MLFLSELSGYLRYYLKLSQILLRYNPDFPIKGVYLFLSILRLLSRISPRASSPPIYTSTALGGNSTTPRYRAQGYSAIKG